MVDLIASEDMHNLVMMNEPSLEGSLAFPSIHKRVNWINAYKNVIGTMADNERRILQAVSG